jgi:hypothetical protein
MRSSSSLVRTLAFQASDPGFESRRPHQIKARGLLLVSCSHIGLSTLSEIRSIQMNKKRLQDFFDKTGPRELKKTKKIMRILLSSDAMCEIVLLFRAKPQFLLTKRDIAIRIEEKPESINSELKKLVELGLLEKKKIGKQLWFISDTKKDGEIQDRMADYISSVSQCSSCRM